MYWMNIRGQKIYFVLSGKDASYEFSRTPIEGYVNPSEFTKEDTYTHCSHHSGTMRIDVDWNKEEIKLSFNSWEERDDWVHPYTFQEILEMVDEK